jgi:hypothetical protein
MRITDLDLSSFRYDPTDPKQLNKLRDDHPDAFNIPYDDPIFFVNDDCVLRYIMLVYDMNSPLWKSIKTHNERKVQGMLMAGFEADKSGRFDIKIEQGLLYGKDKGVARRIVKYVYVFNNVDYSELVGMLEYNMQLLFHIMSSNTNSKTREEFTKTSARIKELTATVFGGKETKEIEEQLYEQLAMSKLSFRPEMIVRQIASGQPEDLFVKDIYDMRKVKRVKTRAKRFGDN